MKQLTLKEIFNAVANYNAISEITEEKEKIIRVYIDDELIYAGKSYKKYVEALNKVYFETFAELLKNPYFQSNKALVIDWDSRTYIVEVFICSEE